MKRSGLAVGCMVFLLLGPAVAQVATGAQAFGSFGGGPFDYVNLGNLNAHFDIPIIQKAGRGAPYTFTLSYDNSVWYPVDSSGTTTWTALPNYGWNFTVPQYAFGYVTEATISSWQQPCNPPGNMTPVNVAIYGDFVFVDAKGTSHPFSKSFYVSYQSISGCAVTAPPESGSSVAVDGSGNTIYANGTSAGANAGIVGSDGKAINLQQTSSTTTDANGNEVTSTTDTHGNMQVTDTLGQNVLTISGTNPVTLAYTAPGGSNHYTITYSAQGMQGIWTNFGCSNIVDPTINGALLISSIGLPDGTSYTFTYEINSNHPTYTTGRLAQVTLPTGGSIAYQYNGANDGVNCADGSTLGLTRTVTPGGTIEPQGTWTYSRAPITGGWQTNVTSPPDPINTNSANDVTLINFAEDSSNNTQNFYETQRLVYQGGTSGPLLETITTCYNQIYSNCSSSPVSSSISQIDTYSELGSGGIRASEVVYNPYGLATDDKEYNYGVQLGAAPSSTYLVRETTFSYGSWNGSTCPTLGNGIVNTPCQVIVYDRSSGQTLASTSYTYDQSALTSPVGSTPQHTGITGSRGNLTTVATKANSGTTLYQVYTYYDTGNVHTATDLGTTSSGGPSVTTYNYPDATSTCGNAFPTGISEPLSLSKSYTWNCIGGVMLTAEDENLNTTTYDYTDPDFWRPDYSLDQLQNKTNYSYFTSPTAAEAYLNFNGTTSVSDQRTTVDGFGRVVLNQRAQTQARANYDTAETDYDIMGRALRATMPFQAAAGGTSTTAPSSTTTYDALWRPKTIQDGSGGTITYSYINSGANAKSDVLVTTSNPTVQKQLEYDGLGRLISVCEISNSGTLPGTGTCGQSNPKTGYWTQYTYDALGNLLTVSQNSQPNGTLQTRQYVYDMLNRLTSETNPESGAKTYAYDAPTTTCTNSAWNANMPGALVQTQDANGNVTCFYRDGLQRVISIGVSGGPWTPCKTFTFDNSTGSYGQGPPGGATLRNIVGRLVEAETDTCAWPRTKSAIITDEWFSYDADGNVTDFYESTPNSGGYYHSQETYWANGAVHGLSVINSGGSLIFPTIYYGTSAGGSGLDGEGRYLKIADSSAANPVTGTTYTLSGTGEPIGSLTKVTFGSADNDSFTYDTGTGRPKTYTFAINGVNDKGTLTWNSNGTVAKLVIADSLPGSTDSQTCNYYYDDLARLGGKDSNGYSADCGSSQWQQLFTYDAFGNITKSGTDSWMPAYNSSANNQYQAGWNGVSYDNSGNLLNDTFHTYTWDGYGNVSSVDAQAIVFDALGRQVEYASGQYQFVYAPGVVAHIAVMSGQTLEYAQVPLLGGAQALYTSSGPWLYVHPDWLGSARVYSTTSRAVVTNNAYAPFGESYDSTGSHSGVEFTGVNADTGAGYDFMFRKYNAIQGRWISPDPAGMGAVDLTNPQTWNRYGYVMNNPLAFIDPQGLVPVYVCVTWTITYGSGSSASPGASGQDCSWQDDGTVDLPGTLQPGETPDPIVSGPASGGGIPDQGPKPGGKPATPVRQIDCNFSGKVVNFCTYACTERGSDAKGVSAWTLGTIKQYPACSGVTSCPKYIFVEAVGGKASIQSCSQVN